MHSQSRHIEFNFRNSSGSGVAALLKHASRGCIDLISRLCTYDPDDRLSAKQALRHPYFKEIRCSTHAPLEGPFLIRYPLLPKSKISVTD